MRPTTRGLLAASSRWSRLGVSHRGAVARPLEHGIRDQRTARRELSMRIREQPTKVTLGLVFAILLLDVVGISMLYPIAPYIVLRYSNDAFMVTLLTVIYAAAQFF